MRMFRRLLGGIALFAAAVLTAACTTESDDPFLVSPTQLTFAAEIGGAAPTSKNVTITANQSDTEAPDWDFSGTAITSVQTVDYTDSEIIIQVSVADPDTVGIGTHSGTVTIASSAHSVTVNVSYTVSGADPVISSVSPYTALAGEAGTVYIGGGGFSRISGTPTVMFGDTAATSAEVVSDSVIRAERPALAAGSHAVTISGSVTFPSTASVEAITATGYPALANASTGTKSKVVEDPERGAFFIANQDAGTVERYAYDGSAWTAASVVLTGVRDIALTPDGSRLMATAGSSLYAIDPAAVTMSASLVGSASLFDYCGERFNTIEFASNGKALLLIDATGCSPDWMEGYLFDPADDSLTEVTSFPELAEYFPTVARSATGRILLYDGNTVSYYDAFNETLVSTAISYASRLATNPDASAIVAEVSSSWSADGSYTVYDGDFISQGTITTATKFDAFAVSNDGTILYAYDSAGQSVTTYDLTTAAFDGTFSANGTTALASAPGTPATMAVSQDGEAPLIGGASNVVVVPTAGL